MLVGTVIPLDNHKHVYDMTGLQFVNELDLKCNRSAFNYIGTLEVSITRHKLKNFKFLKIRSI